MESNTIRFSGFGLNSVYILASAIDENGVIVLGKFKSGFSLPNSDIIMRTDTYGIFLAKYDFSHNLLWYKKIAEVTDGNNSDASIIIIGSDLYILLENSGILTLANGAKMNFKGYILLAFNEDMKLVYSIILNNVMNPILIGRNITDNNKSRKRVNNYVGRSCHDNCEDVNMSSETYLAGTFTNSAEVSNTRLTSDKQKDFVLARMDSKGNIVQIKQLDLGSANVTGMRLHKDKLEITGVYQNSISIDGYTLNEENSNLNSWWSRVNSGLQFESLRGFESNNDEFINSSLAPQSNQPSQNNRLTQTQNSQTPLPWNERSGHHLIVTDLELDGKGNRYMTGRINGKYSFGSSMVETTGDTIFLLKIDRFDILDFIKLIDYDYKLPNNKIYPKLNVDFSGNSYLTSGFHFTARFEGKETIEGEGSYPNFIAKHCPKGNLLWISTHSTTEIHPRKKICLGHHLYIYGNVSLETKNTAFLTKLSC